MVAEAITYDTDFFVQVFENKVYKTENILAVSLCLEKLYKELDKWVKIEDGSAVVTDTNQFSPINFVPENPVAMTFILNRVNEILRFLENKGILSMDDELGDAPVSTEQLDFMTNHLGNQEGFEKEFKRFHAILFCLKEFILAPGSITYDAVMALAQKSADTARAGHNLFTKNIQEFFPEAIDLMVKEYQGNNTIDVTFKYRGLPLSVQVREAEKIDYAGDYYKVYSSFNPTAFSTCDYYAFILPNNNIYIFENDKTKIRNVEGNEIFAGTKERDLSFLFHSDILRNQKKVF